MSADYCVKISNKSAKCQICGNSKFGTLACQGINQSTCHSNTDEDACTSNPDCYWDASHKGTCNDKLLTACASIVSDLESKCRDNDNRWDINKNKECTQLKSKCENCSGCTAPSPPPPPSPTPSTGDCMGKETLKAATDCCRTKINSASYCNQKGPNVKSTCHDSRTKPVADVYCSYTGPSPPTPPTPPPTPPPPGPPSKSSNHALYIVLGIIGGLILIGVILFFSLPK